MLMNRHLMKHHDSRPDGISHLCLGDETKKQARHLTTNNKKKLKKYIKLTVCPLLIG